MFDSGDIVKFYNRTAGKTKFHLCLCVGEEDGIYKFLMINSEDGFRSDIVFSDGEIPGLPQSRTGLSVISMSTISRVKVEKMMLWNPSFVAKMPVNILTKLRDEVVEMASLTRPEKTLLLNLLNNLI